MPEVSLGFPRAGEAAFFTQADAPLPDGGVRVATSYSGLSAGTELTYFRGTNPYLSAGWDPELGVFRRDRPAQAYPILRSGYMEVGTVVESQNDSYALGTPIAAAYGHRTSAVLDPARQLVVPLPPELDPVLGVYIAHMGPICANGVLHAAAERGGRVLADGVRDRRVLVVGGGVIGLLTGLFAKANRAEEVLVVDPTPARRQAAEALGLTSLDQAEDTWATVKQHWVSGPRDRGADVVFQCRGQAASLALALRSLRPQGTVIDLAFYAGGAGELRLGEEFHHNGLAIRCAQIARVPRELIATWDRRRLAGETLALLATHGAAVREHVVSDIVGFAEAPALVADLSARRRHVIQAVFAFSR